MPKTYQTSLVRRLVLVITMFSGLQQAAAQEAATTPPARRPNIVLIVVDTLRADALGCYGYERDTSPYIDRLAEEGMLFERCYSVTSWTHPAMVSMFTGVYPSVHGAVAWRTPVPEALPTLAEKLQEQGYFCAGVVANPGIKAKLGFGRGFDIFDDYTIFLDVELAMFAADKAAPSRHHVNAAVTGQQVTRQAERLLSRAEEADRPFFLYLHYFDPHHSYRPPAPYDSRFDPEYQGEAHGFVNSDLMRDMSERDRAYVRALYDGEIAYEDAVIEELMAKIAEYSDPKDTLTIFVSDHGEAFNEHGTFFHGHSVYREEVEVPLIFHWPGVIAPGNRVDQPVSNMDIAGTLYELLEIDMATHGLDTRSLWPVLNGDGSAPDRPIISELIRPVGDNVIALTVNQSRLIAELSDSSQFTSQTTFKLFQVDEDTAEAVDRWNENVKLGAELRSRLDEAIQQMHARHERYYPSGSEPTRIPLTAQERERLESLGYVVE